MSRPLLATLIALQCALVFGSGWAVYAKWFRDYGVVVRVRFADKGTLDEHGQTYVNITMPKGVTFSSFDSCWPVWMSINGGPSHWETIQCAVEK